MYACATGASWCSTTPSMLVGCDFFLAHRILVLSKQHKLVFTYNGGPIFSAR
jgi:hypothetical protein